MFLQEFIHRDFNGEHVSVSMNKVFYYGEISSGWRSLLIRIFRNITSNSNITVCIQCDVSDNSRR